MACSFMVMKIFVILHVISTHPKAWIIFFFYSLSASIPKHDKIFQTNIKNLFTVNFFKIYVWGWKLRQVSPLFTNQAKDVLCCSSIC